MMFLFILYTSFLSCTEFYIRTSHKPHQYLKGGRSEDVHATQNISIADTFTLTENTNNKGWYYVNVTGKDLVFDIAWNDKVLKYYVKEAPLAVKQQFYFIVLPNLEVALKNANGECMDFWPDKDIFRRLPCNYDKNSNQRFQMIEKGKMAKEAAEEDLASAMASALDEDDSNEESTGSDSKDSSGDEESNHHSSSRPGAKGKPRHNLHFNPEHQY